MGKSNDGQSMRTAACGAQARAAQHTISELIPVPAEVAKQKLRDLLLAAEELHDLLHLSVGTSQALLGCKHAEVVLGGLHRWCLEGVRGTIRFVVALDKVIVLLLIVHV